MTEEEKEQYADWILEECDAPYDEIKYILDKIPYHVIKDMWHPNDIK